MVFMNIFISILGSYAISTLIAEYPGLNGSFDALRALPKHKALQGIIDCNVCLSVFITIPFAVGLNLGLAGYFATIGGVIILARRI